MPWIILCYVLLSVTASTWYLTDEPEIMTVRTYWCTCKSCSVPRKRSTARGSVWKVELDRMSTVMPAFNILVMTCRWAKLAGNHQTCCLAGVHLVCLNSCLIKPPPPKKTYLNQNIGQCVCVFFFYIIIFNLQALLHLNEQMFQWHSFSTYR